MSATDDSPSIWRRLSSLESRARLLDLRAGGLAGHAGDCDRWGLVEAARSAWENARQTRVQSILCAAEASALRRLLRG